MMTPKEAPPAVSRQSRFRVGLPLQAGILVAFTLVAFIATDRWLTLVEDETAIITLARQPVGETVRAFGSGHGQHEHPPLTDLLLHFWLSAGASAPWLLRLPSVVFYLAGLLLFATAARRLGGPRAFLFLLWMGCLSPFGFHFGRLAGWYSFCFFLTGGITLAYLSFVDNPTPRRWLALMVPSLALVYSNYYGWVILGCLGLDYLLRKPFRQACVFLVATFGTLILCYVPMWTLLKAMAAGETARVSPPFLSKVALALYSFYSLFVSESVAPWVWQFSIPAALLIGAAVVLLVLLLRPPGFHFLAYFLILFCGLALIGVITTKRLLFISGWLLLPLALAGAATHRRRAHRLYVLALTGIAVLGWTGILARQYYATAHFIEPWPAVADEAAAALKAGGVVVTNSPSFLFYAHYALQREGMLPAALSPGWVEHERIVSVADWPGRARKTRGSEVLFVKGVNTTLIDQTGKTEHELSSRCRLRSSRRMVPDSGYAFKARMFQGQIPYRVSLEYYACP